MAIKGTTLERVTRVGRDERRRLLEIDVQQPFAPRAQRVQSKLRTRANGPAEKILRARPHIRNW